MSKPRGVDRSSRETVPSGASSAVSREWIVELQRTRIIDATVAVVAEHGFAGASVARVIDRAGVSRGTFYELFEGLEDCFLAVVRSTMGRSTALIFEAFQAESDWLGGVRSALAALLTFLDADPDLARVCVVETLAAGPRALEHRQRELAVLAPLIDAGRKHARSAYPPPALAVEGVIASVIGILHSRLVSGQAPPFVDLLGPLTGLVLLPYLDDTSLAIQIEYAEAMAQTISTRRAQAPLTGTQGRETIPDALRDPVAYRTRQCVLYLAEHPGASNREIAVGIGVSHQGQMSTLLSRLSGLGLLVKHPQGPGRANAWRLTPRGERVSEVLGRIAG